jgi:hypothetical protein
MIFTNRLKSFATLVACFVCWCCTLVYVFPFQGRIVDENYHVPQIAAFMRGDFTIDPHLTTIPGYHLLMAGIMKALSLHSMRALRVINAILGLIPGLIFYAIRRALADPCALLYSVTFFFLPLLYPYYFLAYTDILSLVFILAAFYLALKGHHIWAAFLLAVALLVRQNNVVWAVFIPAIFSLSSVPSLKIGRSEIVAAIKNVAWPYVLPISAFLIYWALHGSISFSREEVDRHPDLAFHPGNLYLFLFIYVLLFFQDAYQGLVKYLSLISRRRWLIIIPLLLIACVHLKGNPDNYIGVHYFLRNALIQAVSHAPAELAFAAVVAIGFCGIVFSSFLLQRGWLIYPFSAFYLGASWLIENRYLIIPFALWMAMRRIENYRANYRNFAIWLCISLFFVWGIFSGRFMP